MKTEQKTAIDRPGLSALTAPQTLKEFLTQRWPSKPYVTHGLGETVKGLTSIPALSSVQSLLEVWPHVVQVHLPDVSDESSSVDANTKDAKKMFLNEMGLLFNNVQTVFPVLKDWLSAISSDLGLPASTYSRCMVYATPAGKGTRAHFDQNINFVLQLHGTKKWRIRKNEHVDNPTQRYTTGQPVDPELASYLNSDLPNHMPNGAEEIILKPGSMLFVPRGYWHSTEAEGEAMALNFTFSQPTWVDLFTSALRSRLTLSPNWRELADGVRSEDDGCRRLAAGKLDFLLQELVEDLPHWRAEDILGATEGI
jgi:50S ribosomal protein L16 3-hydroxylase